MTSFLIKQLLLLNILSVAKVLGNAVTEYPFNYRTGKLNQFVGFATPRLPPSTNGPFIYGSIWASWSAWSFCVNKVRVRVRACNTVRGFSCLGKKQEFMECDMDYMQPAVHESDYAAVDPWEEDRREAMKQLYSQKYLPDELEKENSGKSKIKFMPHESGIRRHERMRATTKGVDGDHTGPHKQIGIQNDEQTTSALDARNSNATAGKSLPLSPFETTTGTPLLTDTKLESNHKLQQVSPSIDQLPIQSMKQSSMASKSSPLQSVHKAPPISLLPQSSLPQSPDKPEQIEQSVLSTATEKILVDQINQIVPSKEQEVIAATPTKVLVWMPPGITTWVLQEPLNNNINHFDISATTPVIDLLNPIAPESSISQINKLPTTSSLSSLSPLSPTELITTKMPKIMEVPSDHQSSIPVPVAKALMPISTAEITRNNEFLTDNSQFMLPGSNIMQKEFKTLTTNSSLLNRNHGISLKKSDQILGEDRHGISSFGILPEHNVHSRYVPRLESQVSPFTPKTYVVDQSRRTLEDGKADFDKAKDNDRAADDNDKILDLLLEVMSSDDNIDQSKKKLLSNKNSYFDQPSSKEIKLDKMKKKVKSLQKAVKAMEEALNGSNEVEAYRNAMDLNLVLRGPPTSTSFSTTSTTPIVIDQSRMFLVTMNENATSNWSEWTNWQQCFCGKQIRTRICHYETPFLVRGCMGKSYESRPCDGRDHCPSISTPLPVTISPISTIIESKFRRSPLYQPLSIATMQKSDDIR
ncbi:unnamed protein product [Cercopithifilaria johnstoni]|uniref:Uncharacterized protein n=1 Tax=Cercopithifilaria johnstoni TaxID=2874296 RepID=A0A8J2M6U2_9BILA|nr:unnamed protein product [Cercopithifilaria johnstoni]